MSAAAIWLHISLLSLPDIPPRIPRQASGIHKTMMGQQSGATSGLAINSLVEQGLNTLAEINDNYR